MVGNGGGTTWPETSSLRAERQRRESCEALLHVTVRVEVQGFRHTRDRVLRHRRCESWWRHQSDAGGPGVRWSISTRQHDASIGKVRDLGGKSDDKQAIPVRMVRSVRRTPRGTSSRSSRTIRASRWRRKSKPPRLEAFDRRALAQGYSRRDTTARMPGSRGEHSESYGVAERPGVLPAPVRAMSYRSGRRSVSA